MYMCEIASFKIKKCVASRVIMGLSTVPNSYLFGLEFHNRARLQ